MWFGADPKPNEKFVSMFPRDAMNLLKRVYDMKAGMPGSQFGGVPIKYNCEAWGDWENSILPNLRPLDVSVVPGCPVVVGWAGENPFLNHFRVNCDS